MNSIVRLKIAHIRFGDLSGWRHDFDDLFVLLNTRNIGWLSSLNYDERKTMTYSASFDILALALGQ